MLVQNTFDNLMDSSLGVRYGVADIQGNTFEKLTGKPFVDMRPMIETVSTYWSNFSINFNPKKNFFCCCHYQNKKALFITDPIFSEGFGEGFLKGADISNFINVKKS